MKYGEQYKLYIKHGADLSQSGLEIPEIEDQNLDYWFAFWELDATRQIGLSQASAISYTEILSYCAINDIDDVTYFQRMIRAMDKAYLKEINKPPPAEKT